MTQELDFLLNSSLTGKNSQKQKKPLRKMLWVLREIILLSVFSMLQVHEGFIKEEKHNCIPVFWLHPLRNNITAHKALVSPLNKVDVVQEHGIMPRGQCIAEFEGWGDLDKRFLLSILQCKSLQPSAERKGPQGPSPPVPLTRFHPHSSTV